MSINGSRRNNATYCLFSVALLNAAVCGRPVSKFLRGYTHQLTLIAQNSVLPVENLTIDSLN